MPTKSSADLLSSILGTLDQILYVQEEQAKNYQSQVTIEVKNNKDIIALLTGMSAMSKNANMQNTGVQVEALARGLSALSKINDKKIESTGKKLEYLATRIANISKTIPQDADKTLKPFSDFMFKFSKLVNGQLIETLNHFGPLEAVKAGLGIAVFFRILAKTVEKMGPKAIEEIVNSFKVNKDLAAALNSIITTIVGIDHKQLEQLIKVSAKMDPSGGQNIANFISPILKILPNKKEEALAKSLAISKLIESLSTLTLGTVLVLALFGKVVNEAGGENIYNFFKNLFKITEKYKKEDIELLTTLFKGIGKAVLYIAVAIGLTVGIVAIAPLADVMTALGIITFVTVGLVSLAKLLGSKDTDKVLEVGIKGIEKLSRAALTIAGAIGLMTMITTYFELEDIITSLGIITLTVTGLVMASKFLSSKENQEHIDGGIKNLQKLCISLLIVTTAIGIMTMIANSNDTSSILLGTAITLGVISFMVLMVKWLSNIDDKDLSRSTTAMVALTGVLLSVSLIATFILPQIGMDPKDTITGGIIVMSIIGLMVGMVKLISMIENKELNNALIAMGVLTGVLLTVSLIATHILPEIGMDPADTITGGLIVMGIIGLMVGMVKLISMIENRELSNALIAMGVLTGVLLVVSLIATHILPEIGANWEDTLIGAGIVVGIVGLMGLMMAWISKWRTDELQRGLAGMAVLTGILLAVSLIANYILPEIGENYKEVILGGAVVLGIVGLMGLMLFWMSKWDTKALYLGIIGMAAMTVMLLAVSLIAKDILPEIGRQWEDAAAGGAVVLGIIALMAAIVYATGQIKLEAIKNSALLFTEISVMLWAVSEITMKYFIPIGQQGTVALEGGMQIVAIIGVMGLLVYAASKIKYEAVIQGGLVMAAIGALLWFIGEAMEPYINTSVLMYNNGKEAAIGGAEIVATIAVWSLIMLGLGAFVTGPLAIALAAGAAVVAGLSAVLGAIGLMLPSYITTAVMMSKNSLEVLTGSEAIIKVLAKIGLIIAAVGAMALNPFAAAAIALGSATILALSGIMIALSKGLDPFIKTMVKIRDNKITPEVISYFQKIFVGNGKGGDGTLMGAIMNIVNGMNEVGLFASAKAGVIASNLRPIFQTLAMFIDIVVKSCSLKYVDEWDKDGKPLVYKTITPEMFKSAGTAISKAFGTFLRELGAGLKMLDKPSLEALKALSKGIKPVMDSVGTFTNAIITVISAAIPDEWDKDGKVIKYRKFDRTEFALAANTIADSFATFMETLIPRMSPLSETAGAVINSMKGGIEPLMNAVNTYTDAITGLIYGKEVTYTDLNGKEIKKFMEFKPEQFKLGAQNISNCFFDFIDTMYDRFSAYGYTEKRLVESNIFSANKYEDIYHNHVAELINGMSGINTIIEAVASFIDLIEKTVLKSKEINLEESSRKISNIFINFLNSMNKNFSSEADVEKIQRTVKSITTSKKLINVFNDAMKILIKGFNQDIINLSEQYANSNIMAGVQVLLNVINYIDKLNAGGSQIDIKAANNHAKYIESILKHFFNALKMYIEVQDVKPNITFISDVVKELEKAYNDSSVSYNKFVTDFLRLDRQYRNEAKLFIKTTHMSMAKTNLLAKAFQNLDNVLKKNERERERILVKFKNNVGDIAKELEKVNKALVDGMKKQKEYRELQRQESIIPINNLTEKIAAPNATTNAGQSVINKTQNNANQLLSKDKKSQQTQHDQVTDIALSIGNAITTALNKWMQKEWKVTIIAEGQTSPWLKGTGKIK